MRETKGHTGNRRSHHKIAAPRLSVCHNCDAYHMRHRACGTCGYYRGKSVIKTQGDTPQKAVVTTIEEKAD